MWKITTGLGVIAAILFYNVDTAFFWITLFITILTFWSAGVMHNYAMESAKAWRARIIENKMHEGASPEEIEQIKQIQLNINENDLHSVPNWLTIVNMIFSFGTYLMLIVAIVKRLD